MESVYDVEVVGGIYLILNFLAQGGQYTLFPVARQPSL